VYRSTEQMRERATVPPEVRVVCSFSNDSHSLATLYVNCHTRCHA